MPMRMNRTTAALSAFEDSAPDAIRAPIPGTGIPIWPLLRWPLASAMSNTEFGIRPAGRVEGRGAKALRALRTAAGGGRYASRRLRAPADVLFVGSGTTVTRTDEGLRNLLFGDLAAALGERAVILQDTPITERPAFARTASFDDVRVRVELAVRREPDRERVAAVEPIVRELIAGVAADIEPELVERAVRTTLARVPRAPRTAAAFGDLLDRVRPRVIVMQGAAYGDRAGQLIEAHRRGILVAELQHGWIGGAHAAYVFGDAATDPVLAAALPDALLTFGEFWHDGIRVPFPAVPVGKPSLDAARARVVPVADRPKRVLIASGVIHPDETADFVLRVRDTLPEGWRVTFRPHPQERSDVAGRYPRLLQADRVDLDPQLDVYDSFANARVVIAGPSTVLYEALALDCPVILRRSAITDYYMDESVFPVSIGADEHPGAALGAVYAATPRSVDPAARERIWAPDAVERFLAWEAGAAASRRVSG